MGRWWRMNRRENCPHKTFINVILNVRYTMFAPQAFWCFYVTRPMQRSKFPNAHNKFYDLSMSWFQCSICALVQRGLPRWLPGRISCPIDVLHLGGEVSRHVRVVPIFQIWNALTGDHCSFSRRAPSSRIFFYSTILSLLDYYLPIIKITKSSADKPWVTSSFRRLVRSRQRAFLSGDVSRYHRLRNRTQRTASSLRKNYFAAKIEQLHSCDPRQF